MPASFFRLPLPELCPGCEMPRSKGDCPRCFPKLSHALGAICPSCLRPECPLLAPCESLGLPHRWPEQIASIESAFWAIGPTFRLLKDWKRHNGRALSERIAESALHRARNHLGRREGLPSRGNPRLPAVIIPAPQTEARRWELWGGSSLRLSEIWAHALQKAGALRPEIVPLLRLRTERSSRVAQAQLDGISRFLREGRMEICPEYRKAAEQLGHREVWLVDDFVTTGKTLEEAASCLLRFGLPPAHAFVLAIRPLRAPERPDGSPALGLRTELQTNEVRLISERSP